MFFVKQKTAYEMRISDWSSDVCSSDLSTGEPDLAPEFWVNAVRGELAKATGENRLATGAEILADGAVEGWWIPKFIADANPEIRSVQDAQIGRASCRQRVCQ